MAIDRVWVDGCANCVMTWTFIAMGRPASGNHCTALG